MVQNWSLLRTKPTFITSNRQMARQTLARWIEEWVLQLPELEQALAPFQVGDVLELDELWSFVQQKSQKRWG